MKWNKYTINTTVQAVDLISSTLMEAGVEGIEVEDNIQITKEEAGSMFVDFLPELPPDDGTAKIHFYLDSDKDNSEILAAVTEGLEELKSFSDIGEGTIFVSQTEDKDWINNWKQYFHPFSIGNLIIKPTWEPVTEQMNGHTVLNIDPGTAFGTGSHETTRLVIKQLQKYVKGNEQILDVGCGSGILSIAALKLGAGYALGTDLDPNAIIASHENAEVNDITASQFEVIEGNIISDETVRNKAGFERYDIVCANILADVLEPLSETITDHMKQNAYFITSGIIDTKEQEVTGYFKRNPLLEIVEVNHDGEWVNITARKK